AIKSTNACVAVVVGEHTVGSKLAVRVPTQQITMSKNSHFPIKSVFEQLISLIDDSIIKRKVEKCGSDRYTKRFKTKGHLIIILFCSFSKCTSLREVSGAMLGLSGKRESFQLSHIPKRSTLSDANKKRDVLVFENIYNA
ncbi:MAG: DUF4372 domain-containing protein, partial [Moheibacter sp.]